MRITFRICGRRRNWTCRTRFAPISCVRAPFHPALRRKARQIMNIAGQNDSNGSRHSHSWKPRWSDFAGGSARRRATCLPVLARSPTGDLQRFAHAVAVRFLETDGGFPSGAAMEAAYARLIVGFLVPATGARVSSTLPRERGPRRPSTAARRQRGRDR